MENYNINLLENLNQAREELVQARNSNALMEEYMKHVKEHILKANDYISQDEDHEILDKLDDTSFLCEDIFLDYMLKDRMIAAIRQLDEIITMLQDRS